MKKLLALIIVGLLICANAFAGSYTGSLNDYLTELEILRDNNNPKFGIPKIDKALHKEHYPHSPIPVLQPSARAQSAARVKGIILNPLQSPLFHVPTNIEGTKIIYGDDDRFEVDEYPSKKFRELSKSVAGMVKSTKLKDDIGNPDFYNFTKQTSEDKFELCEEEPYRKQYTLPICSGFLVAPDILVTAGHCIEDQVDCDKFKWVFDFKKGTTRIKKNDVYSCKKIFERDLYDSKWKLKDYAVIQLDRPAVGRTPLKFRRKQKAKIGTKLVVIGHPSGLPMKVTDNGKIQRMNKEEIWKPISTLFKKRYYFNANLDTYSGNSGSPVFNRKTKLVEGILVQGGEDYVRNIDYFCNESNRLPDSRWVTEEKVFRITKVPFIKKFQDKYLKSLKK